MTIVLINSAIMIICFVCFAREIKKIDKSISRSSDRVESSLNGIQDSLDNWLSEMESGRKGRIVTVKDFRKRALTSDEVLGEGFVCWKTLKNEAIKAIKQGYGKKIVYSKLLFDFDANYRALASEYELYESDRELYNESFPGSFEDFLKIVSEEKLERVNEMKAFDGILTFGYQFGELLAKDAIKEVQELWKDDPKLDFTDQKLREEIFNRHCYNSHKNKKHFQELVLEHKLDPDGDWETYKEGVDQSFRNDFGSYLTPPHLSLVNK